MEPTDTPSVTRCPPHYWTITEQGRGQQRWTCQRCHVVQERSAATAHTRTTTQHRAEERARLGTEPPSRDDESMIQG